LEIQKNNNILGKEGDNFGIVLPLLLKEMFQTQEGNKKKKKLLNLGFSHPQKFPKFNSYDGILLSNY
jgi:hypothetical protein